jgi:hypothetical protein
MFSQRRTGTGGNPVPDFGNPRQTAMATGFPISGPGSRSDPAARSLAVALISGFPALPEIPAFPN